MDSYKFTNFAYIYIYIYSNRYSNFENVGGNVYIMYGAQRRSTGGSD